MLSTNNNFLPRRVQISPLTTKDPALRRLPSLQKSSSKDLHLPQLKSSSPSPILKPTQSIKRTLSPRPREYLTDPDPILDPKTPTSNIKSKNFINAVTRLAFKTRAGQVNGKPKIMNQDSMIIKPKFKSTKGNYLFSVMDGHGTYGYQVSQFIRSEFPKILEYFIESSFSSFSIERNITKSIKKLESKLQDSGIEIAFSGSTLLLILIFGNQLVCSNVGDSRAVLGRFVGGNWESVVLSSDHNVKRNDEKMRILASGGRIEYSFNALGLAVGPLRVWLQNEDIPGLAMTRSIGDKISKVVGVNSDPEVVIRKLQLEDLFIVLASDGLWEKVSNEEVVAIVAQYCDGKNVEDATAHLVNEATRRWRKDDYRDDITVIVVFLQV